MMHPARHSPFRCGNIRSQLAGLLVGATLVCVTGALAQAATVATPAVASDAIDNLPDRPGKDRLVQVCSSCHLPDIVVGQSRDLAGWREVVDQMIARGANVEDADYAAITAYLAEGK